MSTLRAGLALLAEIWRRRGALHWPAAWQQAHVAANGSAPLVGAGMACVGAIMVSQAGMQMQRLLGEMTLVGPAFLHLLAREFGPLLVAILLAARYGAGIAAEIGAMAVSDQLDALRMAGSDPVRALALPRLAGGVLAAVPITVWGCACAYAAGAAVAALRFDVRLATYTGTQLTAVADVVVGLGKAVCFGALVPLVAVHAGMRARLGAPGVGRATTRAVIFASVFLLAADLAIELGLAGVLRVTAPLRGR